MGTKYEIRHPSAEVAIAKDRVSSVAREMGTYPVLVQALLNRGLTIEEIRELIMRDDAGAAIIRTPLKGAEEAARRIVMAVAAGKRVGIFADYDCDGITSGFIMEQGLRAIRKAMKSGCSIFLHYPQRKDGYGLSMEYCSKAVGTLDMVITVDNGIAVREQAEFLTKNGIELIVTDHHEPNPKTLPSCVIVDPCYSGRSRSYLAGAAVTYNVVRTAALLVHARLTPEVFLPAVMLGTISDCMPFTFENACYIKHGLRYVNEGGGNAGFYQSIFYDSYKQRVNLPPVVTAKDISFTIAPKVNSASRMGDTRIAAAGLFLGGRGQEKVMEIAKALTALNDKRKNITADISEKVVPSITVPDYQRIVAFDGTSYGKGIAGLVASRIADRFPDYPAFVYVEREEGGVVILSGSVRCSNESVDCMALFRQEKAKGHIEMCAGHAQACVVTVRKDKLNSFIESFSKLYDMQEFSAVVKGVDAVTSLKAMSNDFLEKVNAIPFTAQDKLLFCIPDVTISRVKFMGGGRHVELHLKDSTAVRTVTWWNHGQFYRDMGSPEKVHIICGIQQDFRMDKTFATLDIVDIVPVKEEGKQNAA